MASGWEVIASGSEGPGARSRHVMAYDRKAKAAVLFGGFLGSGRATMQDDTWELRSRRWNRVESAMVPPRRHRGAMVHLEHCGQSLLFGGQTEGSLKRNERFGGMLGDTWLYADREWQPVRTIARNLWFRRSETPSPRCGHSLAYDGHEEVAVLFGGIDSMDRPLGDTWLFDGRRWRKVAGPAPPARRYAAFAYDPGLQGCVLHGGAEDDNGSHTFGDAWIFRNEAWEPMGRQFDTDLRDDHGLGYHALARRLVMLEGLSGARGVLTLGATGWQSWELDNLHPVHQCSPLVWNDSLGGLMLHGGETSQEGHRFDATRLLVV